MLSGMRTRRNSTEAETTGQGTWDWLTPLGATADLTGLAGSLTLLGEGQEEGRVSRGRLLWKQLPSAACPCDRQARLRALLLLGK